jgi:hypothetical protein
MNQPSPAPQPPSQDRKWPWLVISATVLITVGVLRIEGRRWWCACGHPWPWISDVWSEHCSQHLFDPYSFTHMSHGLICCGLLAWLCPRWPLSWRLATTVMIAAAWEIAENSTFIIERYRHATMSLHYLGDSIGNSTGDILSCVVGFMLAKRLGLWRSIALFLAMELLLLVLIRDNLTLNIVMLIHPVTVIRAWQTAGH